MYLLVKKQNLFHHYSPQLQIRSIILQRNSQRGESLSFYTLNKKLFKKRTVADDVYYDYCPININNQIPNLFEQEPKPH